MTSVKVIDRLTGNDRRRESFWQYPLNTFEYIYIYVYVYTIYLILYMLSICIYIYKYIYILYRNLSFDTSVEQCSIR